MYVYRTNKERGTQGNVLAVVSDKRLPNDEPDVISASDYYPYGMIMPDRNYDAEEYRYGFNTQEKRMVFATYCVPIYFD